MLYADLNVREHISVKLSRSKLFWWMAGDGFDGEITDVDFDEANTRQYIKVRVKTEPRPSHFQTHEFWLNLASPDITAIEKIKR